MLRALSRAYGDCHESDNLPIAWSDSERLSHSAQRSKIRPIHHLEGDSVERPKVVNLQTFDLFGVEYEVIEAFGADTGDYQSCLQAQAIYEQEECWR